MTYVFVDRVIECDPGRRIVAVKALAMNEEFFRDHFPGMPVLPGAMILEGFSQAARECLARQESGHDRWILHEVANMRFNRFAEPGEVVHFEVSREEHKGEGAWFSGRARVEEEGICRARFALREAPGDDVV